LATIQKADFFDRFFCVILGGPDGIGIGGA